MRILIADDDDVLRELLEAQLVRSGHEVVSCENGLKAYQQYMKANRDRGFDLVITDYQMPEKNGVTLITDIRKANREQKCILVTGAPPQLTAAFFAETGVFPVLRKPYGKDELFALFT